MKLRFKRTWFWINLNCIGASIHVKFVYICGWNDVCSNHTYFGKIGVFCELGKFKFQRLNLFDSHYSETFSVVYCDPGHFFLGWTFVILLDTEGGVAGLVTLHCQVSIIPYIQRGGGGLQVQYILFYWGRCRITFLVISDQWALFFFLSFYWVQEFHPVSFR